MLYRIGDIEVWRVLDIHAPFLTPEDLFPTAGPDVAKTIAQHVPGGLCPKTGRLILPVQGFLLKTPDHVVLVDSCVGNHKTAPRMPEWHQREDTRFLAGLTAAEVTPDDVDYVLCTHLHMDHVGWNTQLLDGRWVPTFPNARYLLPSADEAVQRAENSALYTESVLPVIAAGQAEMVESGHGIGDHITLMPTPGHTPGHVSILLESQGERAAITGDAIHSTAQCWHPEWHFRFDADPDEAVHARRTLLEHSCEGGHVVFGSHFALPSLGRVQAQADAFAWEPL